MELEGKQLLDRHVSARKRIQCHAFQESSINHDCLQSSECIGSSHDVILVRAVEDMIEAQSHRCMIVMAMVKPVTELSKLRNLPKYYGLKHRQLQERQLDKKIVA